MLSAFNPRDSTVLVVEDNPDDGLIVAKALQTFGIKKAYAAETAEQALNALEQHAFDVALVDYNLPGMNGLRFVERVRESWPQTRVVMVTGVRDERVAVAAMKAGAADYLTKDELLTSSVIRSLQTALRERTATEENNQRDTIAAAAPRYAAALQETEMLEERWRSLVFGSRSGPTPSLIASQHLTGALEAFSQYLLAAFHGPPERERAQEQSVLNLLFQQGMSPAEIVSVYRAVLRSLAVDTAAPPFNPLVCLARIALLLLDKYQRAQALNAAHGEAA